MGVETTHAETHAKCVGDFLSYLLPLEGSSLGRRVAVAPEAEVVDDGQLPEGEGVEMPEYAGPAAAALTCVPKAMERAFALSLDSPDALLSNVLAPSQAPSSPRELVLVGGSATEQANAHGKRRATRPPTTLGRDAPTSMISL